MGGLGCSARTLARNGMRIWFVAILIAAALVPQSCSASLLVASSSQVGQDRSVSGNRGDDSQQDLDCVTFESGGRLRENEPFSALLFGGLEFRLRPEGSYGWGIAVNPAANRMVDYVWPVSPPYQTAPHLKIGPGYGLTASESVSFHRELRFTLTEEDYRVAFAAAARRPRDVNEVLEMLHRLHTGTLTLEITGFDVRKALRFDKEEMDALSWITFRGKACRPR